MHIDVPAQLKEHEDVEGCNKSSTAVEMSNTAVLPAAVDHAIRFMGRICTLDAPSAETPRLKRTAAIAASAAFGVEYSEDAAEPSRRVLPPSPERRVKKLRDELQLPPPIAALGEAVARVTEELVELRGANRGLEAENAAHRRSSLEVMSLNGELLQDRRSLRASKAARTSQAALLAAEYDPLDRTGFDNTGAGRTKLSRAVTALEKCLLRNCVPVRGSVGRNAEAGVLTASVVKRQSILEQFFDKFIPEGEGDGSDFDEVLLHLPKRLQTYVSTLRCIAQSLTKAFDVVKYCRRKEARDIYYILCAAIGQPVVSERHRAGMMRQVTTVLNLPRGPASVPRRQQGVRASWDQLQA